MKNPDKKIQHTRRSFMAQSACSALGITGIVNTIAHLKLVQGALANTIAVDDYKCLIVLFQFGGTDMNNVLIPGPTHSNRSNYGGVAGGIGNRGVLNIPASMSQPLTYKAGKTDANGDTDYHAHPEAPDLAAMFNTANPGTGGNTEPNLAFVANIGTLVQPTTPATYNSVNLPPQIFSHADQQTQWQSSITDKPFESGWGGRIADLLNPAWNDPNGEISMSVSVAGINNLQLGPPGAPSQYAVTTTGAVSLSGHGTNYSSSLSNPSDKHSYLGPNDNDARRLKAFQDVMDYTHAHLFEEGYNEVVRRARENEGSVGSALQEAATGPGGTVYVSPVTLPDGTPISIWDEIFFVKHGVVVDNNNLTTLINRMPSLARQMLMIVKMIAGRKCLGNKRQIYFCSYGGHDTHQDEGGYQSSSSTYVPGDLDDNVQFLNDAIKAFHDCMIRLETEEVGAGVTDPFAYNDFLLASHSDFNRTFTPNGNTAGAAGSDHAWGTNTFVLGGDVHGGQVYGYYPNLNPSGTGNSWGTPGSNRGRWIPTSAVEQLSAPLANWLSQNGDGTGGWVAPGSNAYIGTPIETVFPNLGRFANPWINSVGTHGTYTSMNANANMNFLGQAI